MAKNIVITVSREAGSGGKLIAKMVAQKLKINFYDEKLIDMIATRTRRRKEVIKQLDEKDQHTLDVFIKKLLDPEFLSEKSFINNLCWVVGALAKEKSCVILGRGVNFILPHETCLYTRVIAPYLTRVYYTQKYEKRTREDVEKRVKKFDHERKEFVKKYFGKDPSNTNYYDLVLNTENVSLDAVVDTIVCAAKLKFGERCEA